jgi:hypothetical protein
VKESLKYNVQCASWDSNSASECDAKVLTTTQQRPRKRRDSSDKTLRVEEANQNVCFPLTHNGKVMFVRLSPELMFWWGFTLKLLRIFKKVSCRSNIKHLIYTCVGLSTNKVYRWTEFTEFFWTFSIVRYSKKHDVSETGSVSVLRWRWVQLLRLALSKGPNWQLKFWQCILLCVLL